MRIEGARMRVILTIETHYNVAPGTFKPENRVFARYIRETTMPDSFSPRVGEKMEVVGSHISTIRSIAHSADGTGMTMRLEHLTAPTTHTNRQGRTVLVERGAPPGDFAFLSEDDEVIAFELRVLKKLEKQLLAAGWRRA